MRIGRGGRGTAGAGADDASAARGGASRLETLLVGVPVLAGGALLAIWLLLRFADAGMNGALRWRIATLAAVVIALLGIRGALRGAGPQLSVRQRHATRRAAKAARAAAATPVAELLRPLRKQHWRVMSYRYLPERGVTLGDLVFGPGGVFHISGRGWDGETRVRVDRNGRLRLGKGEITHVTHAALHQAGVASEAISAALGSPCLVIPVIVASGSAAPRHPLDVAGVAIVPTARLRSWLASQPTVYDAEMVAIIADTAERVTSPNPGAGS